MILVNFENGTIETFIEYEFVKDKYLALYGEHKSYFIEKENIQLLLTSGNGFCKQEFPILYDTSHGPLTIENIETYGVSSILLNEGTKEEIHFVVNMFRTLRKYE